MRIRDHLSKNAIAGAMICAASLSLSSLANLARADTSHQKDVLPGGRAAFMGGAYTAIADDPSCGYYNPAGCAYAKKKEMWSTGTALKDNSVKYEKAIKGVDFIETSHSIFPAFVGANYNFEPVAIGYSFITLDSTNINQSDAIPDISSDQNVTQSYSRTHQQAINYMHAGATVALKLGKRFSIGVSEYYYVRDIQDTDHQMSQASSGSLYVLDYKYTTKNEGLITVVGILGRFDHLSLGLSVRSAFDWNDYTRINNDSVSYTSGQTGVPVVSSRESAIHTLDEVTPNTLQFGAAWEPTKWFVLSSDVYFHQKKEHPYKNLQGIGDKYNLQNTLNFAVGAELLLGPFAVRSGVFTNNSGYHTPREDQENQPVSIDYLGYAIGFGIIGKNFEGSAGAVIQRGTGRGQLITDNPTVQNVEGSSYLYQVTGGYNF